MARERFTTELIITKLRDAIWALLDDSYQPEVRSSFGDGWWIVGLDIEPGTYRTSDDVSYFARLSGFGHELADIIVNKAFTSGSSVIEVNVK